MTAPDSVRAHKSLVSFGAAALLAVTAATAQVASGATGTTGATGMTPRMAPTAPTAPAGPAGPTGIDDSGNYQHEVRSCMTGKTQQDRATCLREARNAQADRKRGRLDNAGAKFEANAQARCDALAGEEKAACQARMMGYGSTTGSVAGGGVLREVETVVVPPGSDSVTVQPQTSNPVVIVPSDK